MRDWPLSVRHRLEFVHWRIDEQTQLPSLSLKWSGIALRTVWRRTLALISCLIGQFHVQFHLMLMKEDMRVLAIPPICQGATSISIEAISTDHVWIIPKMATHIAFSTENGKHHHVESR